MEPFQLPARWTIEITDENRLEINEWKKNQEWTKSLLVATHYTFVNEDGAGRTGPLGTERPEITLDQFRQYVSGKSPSNTEPEVEESYDYLVELFKTKQIQ